MCMSYYKLMSDKLTYIESTKHISCVMGVVGVEIDCSVQTLKSTCFGFSF
jgi:hypothetical protein